MKVITKMVADKEYVAINESGQSVNIDMYGAEEKQAQSPMQLLLSAVSSCAAVDLVQMMKKKRRTINGLEIETDGTRHDGIPAYYEKIHMVFTLISPDATEDEFQKMTALAVEKYCSVSSSLSCPVTFDAKVKTT
jgi:putative redox protein